MPLPDLGTRLLALLLLGGLFGTLLTQMLTVFLPFLGLPRGAWAAPLGYLISGAVLWHLVLRPRSLEERLLAAVPAAAAEQLEQLDPSAPVVVPDLPMVALALDLGFTTITLGASRLTPEDAASLGELCRDHGARLASAPGHGGPLPAHLRVAGDLAYQDGSLGAHQLDDPGGQADAAGRHLPVVLLQLDPLL